MNNTDPLFEQIQHNTQGVANDPGFLGLTNIWLREAIRHQYAHNFAWLGRPIVQVPTDIYAIQELIWRIKPDLIIETGIAHGGSLILSASMLALLDYCEAVSSGLILDPKKSRRRVLGIDIDVRAHNRVEIEAHPMAHLIEMIQGSSIDPCIITQVSEKARQFNTVLVFLDSNHTHDHVLAELEAYAPLVSKNSYCVVWDSGIEDLPTGFCANRPWDKGNNPKTATWEYLRRLNNEIKLGADNTQLKFDIDHTIQHKIVISACSDGFLKRI
jgi:cephalosporin hydroxylase